MRGKKKFFPLFLLGVEENMASKTKQFLDFSRYVIDKLKKETGKELTKQQIQILNQFKIHCRQYIQKIDKEIQRASDTLTLEQRILQIGQLMHPKNDKITMVQNLQKITLDFEEKLNQYLGRVVPITWVNTKTGDIKIASYKDQVQLFKNAGHGVVSKDRKRSYRSLISGVNEDSFKQFQLSTELQELQKQIDKQTKNRAAVLTQSLRRYDKTGSYQNENDEDALALKREETSFRGQYWRVTKRGDKIHWKEIRNRGFIGQGYVSLILNKPYTGGKIWFDTQKMPDYILEAEEQIKFLAEYAEKGDSVPGAIQGDIKIGDGHIQLAVKQGPSFHTASITIDIAIAYAFLTSSQPILLSPEVLNKSLEILAENCEKDTESWQKVYDWLVGIPAQQTKIKHKNLKTMLQF